MKILISILLISSVGLIPNNFTSTSSNNFPKCNCEGFFGTCATTCKTNASCDCVVTANCACDDEAYQVLPTQSTTQYENSEAAQQYFKSLNTKNGESIAIYFETTRKAIEDDDLETYAEQATLLEMTFNDLSETEKTAFLSWAMENLIIEAD